MKLVIKLTDILDAFEHIEYNTRDSQEEMVKSALLAEECKRRTERENFLLSTVPVNRQAAYEPVLHQEVVVEEEEGMDRMTLYYICYIKGK